MKHKPKVRIEVPQLYNNENGVLSAGTIEVEVTLIINGERLTRSTFIRGKVGAPELEPTFANTYFRELDFGDKA